MDQKTLNTVGRFTKIQRYLADNATLVASVGALAAAAATFAGLLAALPATAAADTSGEGATEDKTRARAQLIKQLVPLASALKLYYKDNGNLEEARKVEIRRPSELKTMAALRFEALAATILEALDELPDQALANYNHSAAELTAFRAATTEFGIKKSLPGQLRDAGKTALEAVDEQVTAVRDYVADDLKSAVSLLANSAPDFVRGFKQANKTDDTRGKQNKALRERNQAARAANTPPNTDEMGS